MKWVVLTVVAVSILVAGAAMTPVMATSGLGTETNQVGEFEADLVTITADVAPDGSAAFQVRYAIRLTDENETQAFEALATDINQNESVYLDRFKDRMNATVDAARTATDREMSIQNFSVEANKSSNIGTQYGLVTYSATWSGFAAVTDGHLYIGDAVEGLFIDSDSQFRIEWEDTFTMANVDPEPTETRETAVWWDGPLEFQTGQPNVTLVETTTTPPEETTSIEPPTDPSTTTDKTTTASPPSEDDGLPWIPIAIGGVILAIIGWWVWQQRSSQSDEAPVPADEPHETSSNGDAEEASPPAELLSNEERVESYLESVGGRAKQQEIVDTLGWTEAKTSQVLSEMESAGTIEKFRIGRENVVKLPESEE